MPNLVWLPSQIAKLSDREGGAVQVTLQSMAWAIYRDAPVAPHLREVVDEAWSLIPRPSSAEDIDLLDLNHFVATETFMLTRRRRILSVIDALVALEAGLPIEGKVVTTRYTSGLPVVRAASRRALLNRLRRFAPLDQ